MERALIYFKNGWGRYNFRLGHTKRFAVQQASLFDI